MKFTVTMKDPDTLLDCIEEAVKESIDTTDLEEFELLKEHRVEKINELCGKWFERGEYLRVEIDTEAGTCIVKEAHK